jgi:hypothetical protein
VPKSANPLLSYLVALSQVLRIISEKECASHWDKGKGASHFCTIPPKAYSINFEVFHKFRAISEKKNHNLRFNLRDKPKSSQFKEHQIQVMEFIITSYKYCRKSPCETSRIEKEGQSHRCHKTAQEAFFAPYSLKNPKMSLEIQHYFRYSLTSLRISKG